MSETESGLTRELCEQLEDCGAYIKAHVASYMNASGWADRWVCHRLWVGHLEFKGPTTKLEPLQAKRIREINKRQPGTAFVCRFTQMQSDLHWMRIEDADGIVLGGVGTALALLALLAELQKEMRA